MPDNKPSEEVWTRERCYVTERINDAEIPAFSLAECRVESGVTTELHCLDVDEWYVIVAGCGSMEVGGGPAYPVSSGDTVSIARGESQRISNTGTSDLIFQCVCIPRFHVEGYQALE
jgi:mannose-6-phosphate isomerase-like protein (cupin superfamily)